MRGWFDEKDKFVKKTRINSLTLNADYRDTVNLAAFQKIIFSPMPNRIFKLITGILGLSGVALGALGAHALKSQLTASGQTGTWDTAVLYHLIHTVAILAISMGFASATRPAIPRFLKVAALCWMIGVVLFSGSLYALSLGGPHWLGPVTPLGGASLLFGWGCVLANGLKAPAPPED